MISYDRNRWFNVVFSWRGTALCRAKWRVLAMTSYAFFIQVAYEVGVSLGGVKVKNLFGLDPGQHAVLGGLLGFLIVFRMNASNNRFWEGRTCWGQIINSCRNLVRVGVTYTDRVPTWPAWSRDMRSACDIRSRLIWTWPSLRYICPGS